MSNTRIQYISGWGVTFNDSFPCKDYLNTHGVTKDIALQLNAVMQLTFKNDILDTVKDFECGELVGNRDLHFSEKGFPYRNIPLYQYYSLFEDNNGKHQLGGKPDSTFKMPDAILDSPFIYLGYIKNDNDIFGWIDTEIIHLVCPIFLSFTKLLLSMSNPLSPKTLACTIAYQEDQHNPLTKDSNIEYQPVRFNAETNFDKWYISDEGLGNAGIPEWIQDSDIPGLGTDTMRFLCQLKSNKDIQAIHHNINLANYPYNPENFTSLNFWGDGDLYVFYDPVQKIISYQIQNS